jgi:hypothetical protein
LESVVVTRRLGCGADQFSVVYQHVIVCCFSLWTKPNTLLFHCASNH